MPDRALLVGINAYPGAPLAGCINDITDMANFITTKCGFNPTTVRLLADSRATTDEILDRLDWLVTGLSPGDRILFHYSGHGAQIATRDPKGEADGLDEVICPANFDWSDQHLIRDKQFNALFASIPKGVKAFWISDSCHSGDLTRDAGGLGNRRVKHLTPPPDIAWRMHSVRTMKPETTKDVGFPSALLASSAAPNITLIAGCQSNQTSSDAFFGQRPNGALTYFLLQELNKPSGLTTPLNQVIPQIITSLRQANFDQIPQIEGASPASPFLG